MSTESEMIVTICGCQRCGQTHANMRFVSLDNATDEWAWWAMCPAKQQPVLLRVAKDEKAE